MNYLYLYAQSFIYIHTYDNNFCFNISPSEKQKKKICWILLREVENIYKNSFKLSFTLFNLHIFIYKYFLAFDINANVRVMIYS